MHFRKVVLIVVGVAAIASLAAYSFYGRSVEVALASDDNPCSPEAPIKATITNFTFSPVHRTHFQMEAWRDGKTTNLLSGSSFRADQEIPPFSRITLCYSDRFFENPNRTGVTTPTNDGRVKVDTAKIIDGVHWFKERIEGVEVHAYNAEFVELE